MHQAKLFSLLRCVAGLLLAIAACLKAHQLLTGPVSGDYWWDARSWQALAIGGEILLAGWMWSGLAPRLTRVFALVTFGAFSIMTFSKALAGEASCGCFGAVVVSPWITLGIDVVVFMSFVLIPPLSSHGNEDKTVNSKIVLPWALVAFSGLVGIALGLWTMTAEPAQLRAETGELLGDGSFVLLEPDQWLGHPFPLFSYTDLPDRVRQGNWWVMLYSSTCDHCIETIPKIQSIAQAGQQVALLSMPPHDTNIIDFPDGVIGRLNNTRDWFAQTPVLIEIENGIVVRAANGSQADDWF